MSKPTLRVGMVGYAFMGAAHSQAWRTAPRFFDLPLVPAMSVLGGRNPKNVAAAAERLGWDSVETDWRRLVGRDDVDLVDICTPGDTHAEIAIAALEAGKHVLCEKPLANTVAEAAAMAEAAARATARGVQSMVGFTYRRVPAIALARQLVADGRIGRIYHVRAQYLQDWIVDPDAPLSWRLQKAKAGSGALGDIGAHIVDLTQYISGDSIGSVSGLLETFITERPIAADHAGVGGEPPGEPTPCDSAFVSAAEPAEQPKRDLDAASDGTYPLKSLAGTAGSARGVVDVDDAAVFIARFRGGAVGSFEATRFANGRKNAIRIEINGSLGSLAFDFEDMNLLHFFDGSEPPGTAGFRRILVTEPAHPYVGSWWPPGHLIGYEHGFTHQVVDLVRAIADGTPPSPSFADGLQVQRVLAAVESSAQHGRWEEITQ